MSQSSPHFQPGALNTLESAAALQSQYQTTNLANLQSIPLTPDLPPPQQIERLQSEGTAVIGSSSGAQIVPPIASSVDQKRQTLQTTKSGVLAAFVTQ